MTTPHERALATIARGNELLNSAKERYDGNTLRKTRADKAVWLFNSVIYGPKIIGIDMPDLVASARKGLSRSYAMQVLLLAEDDPLTAHGTTFDQLLYSLDQWLEQDLQASAVDLAVCLLRYTKRVIASSLDHEVVTHRLKTIDGKVNHFGKASPFVVVHLFITGNLLDVILQDVSEFVRLKEITTTALAVLESQDAGLLRALAIESSLQPRKWGKGAEPSIFPSDYAEEVLKRIHDDWELHSMIALGHKILKQADAFWAQATAGGGDVERLQFWGAKALDEYRAALLNFTDRDQEMEGTLYVRLAVVRERVSTVDAYALAYWQKAVALADSMKPATPTGPWYAAAQAALRKRKDAAEAKEASMWHNRRVPIFEKLKHMFIPLDGKYISLNRLCEHIFERFPPKTPGPKTFREQVKGDLTRSAVLKIIHRYHTDRNHQYGDEWLVVCEEITKRINSKNDNRSDDDVTYEE